MKKVIKKIFNIPNVIYNKIMFAKQHVQIGEKLTVNGKIYCVSNSPDGITIGNNVRINSGLRYNPIGGDVRTILFAKENGKIKIGNNVAMSNVTIFSVDSITIEDDVMIGGSVKIYDTDFHWLDYSKRINETGGVERPVVVKKGAFIGAHSVILKGVVIGERAVVGANSVVAKNVPDDEIWAGNPARFIRKIEY